MNKISDETIQRIKERWKDFKHPTDVMIVLEAYEEQTKELERLKREIESHAPEGRNYTNAQYVELRSQLAEAVKALKYAHRFAKRDDLYDKDYVNQTLSHIGKEKKNEANG